MASLVIVNSAILVLSYTDKQIQTDKQTESHTHRDAAKRLIPATNVGVNN